MRKSAFAGLVGFTVFAAGFDLIVFSAVWVPGGTCHPRRPQGDFLSIGAALLKYQLDNGRLPTTAQGLEALVSRPTIGPPPPKWSQIMRRVPTDPWGNPYGYECLGKPDGTFEWRIISIGPDGLPGTTDDLRSDM